MKIFQGMLAAGLLASTLYPCQTQAQPAAPSELAASSVSSSEIDLTWIDNSSNELNFQLQFATNDAFSPSTKRNIGPENITSYEHTGLDPITTYWYRIKAKQGASASAWSDPAFATTAPDGVVATAVSSSAIDVDWTPTANTNISGYTVRYSTAAGSCKDRPVAGGNGSSTYTATGLVPSTTYNVSVKAEGGAYSSAFSAPANATTSPDGLSGTRISPLFFGQNAWLPIQIGASDDPDPKGGGDLEELLCGTSYASGGVFHGGACVAPSVVSASGVKLMRYGGNAVDKHYDADESPAQYLTMVDNMRANGIEPLLEVPYGDGAYSEQAAAELVRYINITHDRCVRYWTIANEPDHYESNDRDLDPSLDATDIAANIATYFKAYVTAMRNVDPTIVIVGPDLSFYDDEIMNQLLAPNGPNDICGSYQDAAGKHYYLDVVDFHNYPFSGLDPGTEGDPLDPPEEDPDQTRPNIIAYPQGPVPGDPLGPLHGFQGKVTAMKALVDRCNDNIFYTRTGTEMLKMAVTEINIEYRNPADKTLSGVSAPSFLAGQYWADVMNVGMQNGLEFIAFWSVKEGDLLRELGYIKNDYSKLPTYYHYQMLAQNFRGVYAPATSVKVNLSDDPNVKAFGAKDLDQIVVMLLNQNQNTTALTYTVRLDGGTVTGNKALKVSIGAGVNRQYNNPAGGKLAPESTVMLVFDQNGNLLHRYVYGLSSGTAGPTVTPPLP